MNTYTHPHTQRNDCCLATILSLSPSQSNDNSNLNLNALTHAPMFSIVLSTYPSSYSQILRCASNVVDEINLRLLLFTPKGTRTTILHTNTRSKTFEMYLTHEDTQTARATAAARSLSPFVSFHTLPKIY